MSARAPTWRRREAAAASVAAFLLVPLQAPAPAAAWGAIGHRLVAGRAADALPGPLGDFARAHRQTITDRALDPDLIWREECGRAEAVTHYFDADLYGPDPSRIAHDLDRLRAEHGAAAVEQDGLLPWKIEEMAGCLVRAFATGDETWARDLMGQLAHYTGDLAQPFHLTSDYDGQSTGQVGIHHRFEDGLVERRRYSLERVLARTRIDVAAKAPLDVAFGALDDVPARVRRVLEADRAASAQVALETKEYYQALARVLEPSLASDLARGARMTAEVWLWSWEQAGRPPLTTRAVERPPQPGGKPAAHTRERTHTRR